MSEIEVTQHGHVTVIRINRPAVRNAINTQTAHLLREAWLAFEEDDNARVGILTGTDGVFSSGADLNDLDALLLDATKGAGPMGIGRMIVHKPTIAAVAGYAVAGGFELALWCDLCIVDETAVFGFFERKVGVPLLNGGSKRLTEHVGLRRGLDIVLTGRPVHAEEALAIGLATELVPKGQALTRAIELGQELAAYPQTCLRADRQAIYDNIEFDLDKALIHEAQIAAAVIASGEPDEGMRRYFEQRRSSQS